MWPVGSGHRYGFGGVGRCFSEGRVVLGAHVFDSMPAGSM